MSKHDSIGKNRSGTAPEPNTVRVDAPGGTLVFEVLRKRNSITGTESIIGTELVRVEDVTDADALAQAVDNVEVGHRPVAVAAELLEDVSEHVTPRQPHCVDVGGRDASLPCEVL